MKHAFLEAYEDGRSDKKEEKEDEAISLYVRTLEADFGDENIEVALMVIEESQTEEEVIRMMAMNDSETEDETNQLIRNLSCLKHDLKELESDRANLEKQVKDLKNQVLELTSENEKFSDIHGKGKMSDLQDKLENELKRLKIIFVMLNGKRHKNFYKISIMSLPQSEHICLSVVEDDLLLWYRSLGHASRSQLNKLAAKDLVLGLPKAEFSSDKVCDACVRGKHVRSSFKSKQVVSTSKPLELLHMDLCGPMRVRSGGGKRYIFVIVDDFSRCMIIPILEKTPYELLRGRKPNFTHLRAFGSKYFVHNNGKEAPEENIHVIFDESNNLAEKGLQDEDYDIGLTGDGVTKESEPQYEDGSEDHKEIDRVQTRSSLRNLCAITAFLSHVEPKTIKESLKDPDWIMAIQEELNQFEISKVYNQEEGIDYDETFAPVARMQAIRMLLAFAAHMEFTLYQMDVKSAFLNGYLKEEVFVKQPPGFESEEFPDYVFKLDKDLYGRK
nr:uncharacterized protein LOC117279058 [Nicotiana tomentosiformis]